MWSKREAYQKNLTGVPHSALSKIQFSPTKRCHKPIKMHSLMQNCLKFPNLGLKLTWDHY